MKTNLFGKRLKALRERHGLTQSELGDSIGVSSPKQHIHMLETGTRHPTRKAIDEIAVVLGIPGYELNTLAALDGRFVNRADIHNENEARAFEVLHYAFKRLPFLPDTVDPEGRCLADALVSWVHDALRDSDAWFAEDLLTQDLDIIKQAKSLRKKETTQWKKKLIRPLEHHLIEPSRAKERKKKNSN